MWDPPARMMPFLVTVRLLRSASSRLHDAPVVGVHSRSAGIEYTPNLDAQAGQPALALPATDCNAIRLHNRAGG